MELIKTLKKILPIQYLAYGEQYVVARAAANTKDMSAATDNWKKVMQEGFDYERDYNRYFSGQLDEIQANFESARFNE